jgi:hypothetical protein
VGFVLQHGVSRAAVNKLDATPTEIIPLQQPHTTLFIIIALPTTYLRFCSEHHEVPFLSIHASTPQHHVFLSLQQQC